MDSGRLSHSGRVGWILLLAGLWSISLSQRSNPDESQGEVKSNQLKVDSTCNDDSDCNHGYCFIRQCTCFRGYTGPRCDEVPSPCSTYTCIHGYCPSVQCVCDYGYKGPTCDEVASCNTSTCIHGYCDSSDTCSCIYGYKGPTCDEDSATTTSSSCNSYSCTNGNCVFGKCTCKAGYTGPTCNQASSSANSDWIIAACVILPLLTPIIILLCSLYCVKGCCGCSRICKCCRPGTKTTLTTAIVEENVYVDIAVISSGRY